MSKLYISMDFQENFFTVYGQTAFLLLFQVFCILKRATGDFSPPLPPPPHRSQISTVPPPPTELHCGVDHAV